MFWCRQSQLLPMLQSVKQLEEWLCAGKATKAMRLCDVELIAARRAGLESLAYNRVFSHRRCDIPHTKGT